MITSETGNSQVYIEQYPNILEHSDNNIGHQYFRRVKSSCNLLQNPERSSGFDLESRNAPLNISRTYSNKHADISQNLNTLRRFDSATNFQQSNLAIVPIQHMMVVDQQNTVSADIQIPRRVQHWKQTYSNSALILCLSSHVFNNFNWVRFKNKIGSNKDKHSLDRARVQRIFNVLPKVPNPFTINKYDYKVIKEKLVSEKDSEYYVDLWLKAILDSGI